MAKMYRIMAFDVLVIKGHIKRWGESRVRGRGPLLGRDQF